MPARAERCWANLRHYWDALHVERHGKYSVERLYSLKLYSARTGYLRALLVILLTPIPCITTTILADLIPLAPPAQGLAHSHMFWVRVTCICWYISFTIVDQCRHFIVRLPMTKAQVLAVSTFVVASSTAVMFGFAEVIGFPLPFFQAMITPGWLVALVISIVFVWGKHFKHDPRLKYDMAHYALVVTAQTCMTFVYPAYIFAFRKLSGSAQVGFALFLPVVKVFAKNVMNYLVRDLEDAKPEFIIFNVEVFHALFIACCMQSASSYHTTIILMVADFVLAILSLHKIFLAIHSLEDLVLGGHQENVAQVKHDSVLSGGKKAGPRSACPRILHYVEAVIFLLENDRKLVHDAAIRVLSHATRDSIGRPKLNVLLNGHFAKRGSRFPGSSSSRHFRKIFQSKVAVVPLETGGPATSSSQKPAPKFIHKITSDSITAFPKQDEVQSFESLSKPQPPPALKQPPNVSDLPRPSQVHLEVLTLTSKLTDDDKRAVLALSDSCRVQFVQQVLSLLHRIEFLLLVEFTEVMIPVVYCKY